MRTLLLDQSSSCIGYAVLDDKELIGHGDLKPTNGLAKAPARLYELQKDLEQLAALYRPDEMVIEWHHYPGMKNMSAIEGTANSAGICNMIAATNHIPVYRLRNKRWQAAIGAKGKDDSLKRDVKRIVCRFWELNPDDIRSFDHSDVLGMSMVWRLLADDLRKEWLESLRKGKRK